MRFGSVCSGIEAASVAWHPLGWEAAWLSEIEPFPCAVLKHHYPDVPNHGDMTLLPDRILSGEVEAPDLFCGGTPCQAFSVAGLRNSLKDSRGNLSLTFVGIANAIDHVRSVRRDAPAIIFWENVPGVLNTKDNAFGCFLGALAGESEPITAPGERWSNAGCVFGPQRTVAWRVLDAQYFGVAQRRRRVFVVASARDDFNPAEVLFEFEGVRRDIAPSRQARKVTPTISSSGTGVSRVGFNCEDEWFIETPVVGALDTECGGNKMNHQTINSGHLLPVSSFYESSLAQYREANVSGTIKASGGVAGGGSETFLAQPAYAIQGSMIGRNDSAGPQGDGINVEVCFTQNTIDRHAVAQPIPLNTMNLLGREIDDGRRGFGIGEAGDPSPTLTKNHSHAVAHIVGALACNTGPNGHDAGNFACNQAVDAGHVFPVAQAIPIDTMNMTPGHSSGGLGFGQPGDPSFTLTKGHSHAVAQPFQQIADCLTSAYGTKWNGNASATNGSLFASQPIAFEPGKMKRLGYGNAEPGLSHALRAEAGDNQLAIATSMAVRRLTPVECERLQGFPDGYTNIPWRKAAESPDGPRYKALGNSWAVPVVRWIGKRIQERITT
jgi:DNA (cytosine-5)-methyltransferase 1